MREEFPSEQGDVAEPGLPSIEGEAIRWVVRLTSGKAGAADRAQFKRWRAQSPDHEAALVMARQLWIGVGQVVSDHCGVITGKRKRLRQLYAVAAALFLGSPARHQAVRT
jgi:transmembrane sensor